jgi:hypothetical protein
VLVLVSSSSNPSGTLYKPWVYLYTSMRSLNAYVDNRGMEASKSVIFLSMTFPSSLELSFLPVFEQSLQISSPFQVSTNTRRFQTLGSGARQRLTTASSLLHLRTRNSVWWPWVSQIHFLNKVRNIRRTRCIIEFNIIASRKVQTSTLLRSLFGIALDTEKQWLVLTSAQWSRGSKLI